MAFYPNFGDFLPKLDGVDTTAEALATYVERTFPAAGRRKAVMTEWDLGNDEARTVIEGRPSKATLERIFKHKNGGWRVILPVMGAVIGQTADDYIIAEAQRLDHERKSFDERRARLGEMARALGTVVPVPCRRSDRLAG